VHEFEKVCFGKLGHTIRTPCASLKDEKTAEREMYGRAGVRLGRGRAALMKDELEKQTECSSCKTKNEPGGRRKVDDGMLFL
jgi:hypothetical protein